MIYLTAEASAVHFPALGRTERPGTGSLLTWRSVDEEGRRLPASAHAVSEHPASASQPRIAVSIPILRDAGGAAVMAPLHFGGCRRRLSEGDADCDDGAGVHGDPHLTLAHGGVADFRGRDGKFWNFLSAANVSVNLMTQDGSPFYVPSRGGGDLP
jgi:hypothetical protein